MDFGSFRHISIIWCIAVFLVTGGGRLVGAGEGGVGLGGGGKWESYQSPMLHSPSIWGEH